MNIITDNETLKELCAKLAKSSYIAVDTEFLRERTYYAKLCLIQVASPEVEAFAIDPIANTSLDLEPFYNLLSDENLLKVFHAARQDLEIFHNLTGKVPFPIYDTQIAAMVCGYGEQIGYDNLVRSLTSREVDKTNQYTDWSRRPLTNKQLVYALNDVIYLMEIYDIISAKLKNNGRETWVKEEVAFLYNEDLYDPDPSEIWRKVKVKSQKPNVLACLKELAAWRENQAREKNIPKGRIIKDDAMASIAMHLPKNKKSLSGIRGVNHDFVNGKFGSDVLKIIDVNSKLPFENCPQIIKKKPLSNIEKSIFELIRMLLKIRSAEYNVAPKLVATPDDLEKISILDNPDIAALKGWRYEVFGKMALSLKEGNIAISLDKGKINIIDL